MSCIFIFRRDFRLTDNTALIKCINMKLKILPIFIFDPEQLNRDTASSNFIEIMCKSLIELETYINKCGGKITFLKGAPHLVVKSLLNKFKNAHVAFNRDYSPYSLMRDNKIYEIAKDKLICCDDLFTHDYCFLKTVYHTSFGRFKKSVLPQDPLPVATATFNGAFMNIDIKCKFNCRPEDFFKPNLNIPIKPGRAAALERVKKMANHKISISEKCGEGTSLLSSYLHCGTISIREVYNWACRNNNLHIKVQLIWRQFYFITAIIRNKKYIGDFDKMMKAHYYRFYDRRFKTIKWRNDAAEYTALWSGKTGFPIIDAAVRQLNKTGFMHNRGRLLVGYFSVKILRISPWLPKWGGQAYFAAKLIDCCWANNVGNWRWVSSDTLDRAGQRFGRGYSGRMTSIDKWNAELSYIKCWVPELKDVPDKDIINWYTAHKKYKNKYFKPIVDTAARKREWMDMTSG